MRTKHDLERFTKRNIRKVFVDVERGGGAGRFFHIDRVKDDVDILTLFSELGLHVFDPVGKSEIRIFAAFDVDLKIERVRDTLFFGGSGKIRLAVLLGTNFGHGVPDLGVGIRNRRLVGNRNMRAFDRHERIEQLLLTPMSQILVFFVSVLKEDDVSRLSRNSGVRRDFRGFLRSFRSEDELALFHERFEPLHDLGDLDLIGDSGVARLILRVDDRKVLLRVVIANRLLFLSLLDKFASRGEIAEQNGAVGVGKNRIVLDAVDRQLDILKSAVRVGRGELTRFGRHDANVRFDLLGEHFDVRLRRAHQIGFVFVLDFLFRFREDGV